MEGRELQPLYTVGFTQSKVPVMKTLVCPERKRKRKEEILNADGGGSHRQSLLGVWAFIVTFFIDVFEPGRHLRHDRNHVWGRHFCYFLWLQSGVSISLLRR